MCRKEGYDTFVLLLLVVTGKNALEQLEVARFSNALKLVQFRLDRLSATGRNQTYRSRTYRTGRNMAELWPYYSVQLWMPSSVLCRPP
jgi:hypothetical protein